MAKHYVYIVEANDGTLYTGYTVDINRRIKIHNAGKGAKYLRGNRLPVKLVYWEEYYDKGKALSREYAIKKLNKKDKMKLIDRG